MSPPPSVGSVAWAVRRMDRPVSSVHLMDGVVLAGDWDGCLVAWDIEGDQLWSLDVGDRVGRIVALSTGTIGCTAGLDAAEITMTGDLLWSTELDGTSDHLVELDDGILCATSAVWDIEHGDFMEGAVWCLDHAGEVLHVERFDERPWDLLCSGAVIYLALAHPRSGLLHGDSDGLTHLTLGESPATALQLYDGILHIGTSAGEIWSLEVAELQSAEPSDPAYEEETSVQSMVIHDGRLFIATETSLSVLDTEGEVCWRWTSPSIIEGLEIGLEVGPTTLAIIYHGRDTKSGITLVDVDSGEVRGHLSSESTIHTMHVTQEFLVVGLDSGEVCILQGDLLARRLTKGGVPTESEAEAVEQRSSMLARLRALRKDE